MLLHQIITRIYANKKQKFGLNGNKEKMKPSVTFVCEINVL